MHPSTRESSPSLVKLPKFLCRIGRSIYRFKMHCSVWPSFEVEGDPFLRQLNYQVCYQGHIHLISRKNGLCRIGVSRSTYTMPLSVIVRFSSITIV